MAPIYTIGYERAALEDFLATLTEAGVQTLVDIRERPYSRRTEFSKGNLQTAVEQAGLHYRHERALGAPAHIRHAVQETGDYATFFRRYREHLAQQEDSLERLTGELEAPLALLCYEADPAQCHRSAVAERLSELTGAEIRHLQVNPHPTGPQQPLDL